jgi:hypothetical protein
MVVKTEVLKPAAIIAFNKFVSASDQLPIALVWDIKDILKVLKEKQDTLIQFLKELDTKYPQDCPEKVAEFTLLNDKEFEIPIKEKIILPNTFTGLNAYDLEALDFLIARNKQPENVPQPQKE